MVENIISSHKKVTGMGEINYLNKFFNLNFIKNDQLNIDFINDFLKHDLQKYYFEFIKFFNIKTEIITDKSLNIYWYLGFIDIFFQMQNSFIVKEAQKIIVYQYIKTYLKMDKDGNTMNQSL